MQGLQPRLVQLAVRADRAVFAPDPPTSDEVDGYWDTVEEVVAANAKGEKKSAADLKKMDYDQLQALYQKTAAEAIKDGKTLYELLRAQLPVYPV